MSPVPDTIDGRTARALRTRAAIVDACVALVEEGDVRPTTPNVAERAGVSVRSIFQHFDDLEGLYAAVADRYVERVAHFMVPLGPTLPLPERLSALVQRRAGLLETISPVRRAAAVHAPFSDEVRRRLRSGHQTLRDEIAAVFAPELDRRPATDRLRLLDSLDIALSWSSWDILRTLNGRDVDAAAAVLMHMTAALLVDGEPSNRSLASPGAEQVDGTV